MAQLVGLQDTPKMTKKILKCTEKISIKQDLKMIISKIGKSVSRKTVISLRLIAIIFPVKSKTRV